MRKYLIVDDNRAFAENLAELLVDQGSEASVVTSGAQALDLVRQTRFDALVTDMRMPGMGGAQLIHEVRQVDPGLPAVVVTAYTGEDDLSWARKEGILTVLPKPFPIAQMLALLEVARRDALVAVVEDDINLSDNLAEALRDQGFTSIVAHSAKEAERLEAARPFAALVDLRLPGSPNGEVFTRFAERLRNIPVLVITGFPNLALPIKPWGLFQKPFDTARLLRTLDQLYREGEGK